MNVRRPEHGSISSLVMFLVLSLWPSAATSDGPTIGQPFQVNSYTTGFQGAGDVAMAPDKSFVVVWSSEGSFGSDTSFFGIQGRRYTENGAPLGDQFQVNTYTTGSQVSPRTDNAADGSFVVVWTSAGSFGDDTDSTSVQGQRYDASGMPLGSQFQVNSYTTGFVGTSRISMAADGQFVVVWSTVDSPGDDDSGFGIQARRFASDTSPLDEQFQVNTYTTGRQEWPSVTTHDGGEFVVVWHSRGSFGSDDSYYSIQARRYDAGGTPQGPEFEINSYTTGGQAFADVSTGPDGDFVVVWGGDGPGTTIYSSNLFGRRFRSDGTPLDSQFRINTNTTGGQGRGRVAIADDGAFVVVWEDNPSPGNTQSDSVFGRLYRADGTAEGDAFQIDSYTTGGVQADPEVAVAPDGDFVVAWNSEFSDTDSDYSVQGQRFSRSIIFANGFETGDTSAWSSTTPDP